MSVTRSTSRTRLVGLLCAALVASGCSLFGMPDLSFLDDPDFRSLMVGVRVLIESPSRSPLYTEDSLVPCPALAGTWSEQGNGATWVFEAGGGTGYRLTVTEAEFSAALDARVVRLGRHRFVDIRLADPTSMFGEEPGLELRAFFKLVVGDDGVQLAALSQDWLREALNDADVAIDHTINASGLITLTAATAELRAFVLSATNDPEAFPGPEASGPGFELSRLSKRTR